MTYHFPPYQSGSPPTPENPSANVYESADTQAGVLGLVASVYPGAGAKQPPGNGWKVQAEASFTDSVYVPNTDPAPKRLRVVTSFARKGVIVASGAKPADVGLVWVVCTLGLSPASEPKGTTPPASTTPIWESHSLVGVDGTFNLDLGDVNLSCELPNPQPGDQVTVTLSATLSAEVMRFDNEQPSMNLLVDSSGQHGITVPGYLAQTFTA